MPHPEVPPEEAQVTVPLDRPRPLRIDLWTFWLARQELTRQGLQGASLRERLATGELDFPEILILLWAGLRCGDPDSALSLEDVGHLIHPGNLLTITDALQQLFNQGSIPAATGKPPDGTGAAADPLASTGTGSPSGPEPALISASAPPSSGA